MDRLGLNSLSKFKFLFLNFGLRSVRESFAIHHSMYVTFTDELILNLILLLTKPWWFVDISDVATAIGCTPLLSGGSAVDSFSKQDGDTATIKNADQIPLFSIHRRQTKLVR